MEAAVLEAWRDYGAWVLLAFSLVATVIHGGQEIVGWWGERAWPLFFLAQVSFVALALVGFACYPPALWALAAFKAADAIGFHLVFFPQWPGGETWLLPLADAAFVGLYLVA